MRARREVSRGYEESVGCQVNKTKPHNDGWGHGRAEHKRAFRCVGHSCWTTIGRGERHDYNNALFGR